MELSFSKLLIILVIVLLIFGAGKLPQVMGELGKGMRSLKEGLKGDQDKMTDTTKQIEAGDKDKNV